MKRLLALLVLPLVLTVTGCSMLGGGDWDEVQVSFDASTTSGDYTLVVTPTEATYTLDGKATSHELPTGVWTVLTTGLKTLGDRTGDACLDGQTILIEASAAGEVKQAFEANSCDAGDAFTQAQSLIEQVLSRLR